MLQIYVGVLVKYVNFGKGWRHRLFVLKGGVLQYYKVWLLSEIVTTKRFQRSLVTTSDALQVFGPNAINAYSLLEGLRQQGDVVKIGSEIEVAESKWKRYAPR